MLQTIKKNIFPILLSVVVVVAVLEAFMDAALLLVLPIFFCICGLFIWFEFIRKRPYTAVFYLFTALGAALLAYLLVRSETGSLSFFSWVVGAGRVQGYGSYFGAIFVVFSFMAASFMYYFSVVVYRATFQAAIVMIPALVYTRKALPFSRVYSVLVVLLFFIVMALGADKQRKDVHDALGSKNFIKNALVLGLFVSTLVLALSFVKLPEVNQNLIKDTSSLGNLLRYNKTSGLTQNDESLDTVLFLVEAEEPVYLMRQIFSRYTGTEWIAADDRGYTDWEKDIPKAPLETFWKGASLLQHDLQPFLGDTSYLQAMGEMKGLSNEKIVQIIPQNIATQYVLAPLNTFDLLNMPEGLQHARTRQGEIYTLGDNGIGSMYYAKYYEDGIRENLPLREILGRHQMDVKRLWIGLSGIQEQNLPEMEPYFEATMFMGWQETYSSEYKLDNSHMVSELLTGMAENITAGATGSYEKALALETYFHTGGFTYSTEYRPPQGKESIEYFVSESKTGACGSYATAMTLMARSVGLSARYVEGFVSDEKNSAGQYVVRAKHSHAFCQVYIPGYGWTNFDPTVPAAQAENNSGGLLPAYVAENATVFFGSLTLVLAVLFVGILLYRLVVEELLFRASLRLAKNNLCVMKVYRRMARRMEQQTGRHNLSPKMLEQEAARLYHLDIGPVVDGCNRALYNHETLSAEDKNKAIQIYRQFAAARKAAAKAGKVPGGE